MALHRGSAAYTLTESVLVLVLVGIIASVAAPRFFAVRDFDERFFFDEVRTGLRFAQKLAVASGCEVRVDIAAGSYELLQRVSCSSGAFSASVRQPGSGASTFDATAPAGTVFTSSVAPLHFDSLGRATDATGVVGPATLTIGTRTLVAEGESGFVHEP